MSRFLSNKEHGPWRERVLTEERVLCGPAPYSPRVGTPHRVSSALTADNLHQHTATYDETMSANVQALAKLGGAVQTSKRPTATVARALGRDLRPEDLFLPPTAPPYASPLPTVGTLPRRSTSAQKFPLPRQLMSKFRTAAGAPVNDPLEELGPQAPPTSNGTYGQHAGLTMSNWAVHQQLMLQSKLHEELTGAAARSIPGGTTEQTGKPPRGNTTNDKQKLESAVCSLAEKVDSMEAAIRAERTQRDVLKKRVEHLAALASITFGMQQSSDGAKSGGGNATKSPTKHRRRPSTSKQGSSGGEKSQQPLIARPFSNNEALTPPRLQTSPLRQGTAAVRTHGRGVFPHFANPM